MLPFCCGAHCLTSFWIHYKKVTVFSFQGALGAQTGFHASVEQGSAPRQTPKKARLESEDQSAQPHHRDFAIYEARCRIVRAAMGESEAGGETFAEAFAREADHMLMLAVLADDAGETVGENPHCS